MLLTVAAAIVVLGAVIFVHELGHFLVAKATGVGVVRFSIGFGPATPLQFRWGETEYVVAWFPFGGYVMMASDEETGMDEASGVRSIEGGAAVQAFPPERMFESKPLWARILVISAGVTMNVVFAWCIYTGLAAVTGKNVDPTTTLTAVDTLILPAAARPLAQLPYPLAVTRINDDTIKSWNDVQQAVLDPTSKSLVFWFAGRPQPVTVNIPGLPGDDRLTLWRAIGSQFAWPPRLGIVLPGHPAAAAGLDSGDVILTANGDSLRYWPQLVHVIETHPGDTVTVTVARGDSVFTTRMVPEAQRDSDYATGGTRTVGKIGVGPGVSLRHAPYSLVGALGAGVQRTAGDTRLVVYTVEALVLGRVSPRELGGPIFVGQLSGEAAQIGLSAFLAFIALFSVNLAVLNLLPIPVLDGGRLVFLLAEGVLGRPLSRGLRMRLSQVGVALLLGIMLLALTNDVLRLFGD
jgi:regulator of sigma E protease